MLDFIRNAGAFVVAIGILVAFHEFGHFWVARKLGVKVLRYSIGFGKPLWLRKGKDGCEYALSAIPLGGYVKMLDEREGEVAPEDAHRAFNRQSPYKRFAIVAAGPIANFLLAIVFFWMVYVIGQPGLKPVLAAPSANSAAALAGIREGEVVLTVDGKAVETWNSLQPALLDKVVGRKPITLLLQASIADTASRSVVVPLDKVRVDPEYLFADLGLKPPRPKIEPRIHEILPGTAAEEVGLRAGDLLLTRDGVVIDDFQDFALWVQAHAGAMPVIGFERNGAQMSVQPLLKVAVEAGRTIGRLGAGIDPDALSQKPPEALRAEDHRSPLAALPAAIEQTWSTTALTLRMLGKMLTGEVSLKNVSGAISIAQAAGFTASIGITTFLSFLALVSVSLGVLNLLPVPLLDGGHLVYYAIEIVKGSPLSEQVMAAGQRVGLTFLMLLMGLAFYNDISRLIG